MKNDRWVFHEDAVAEETDGVTRRVLAYSDDLMVVENTFERGAVGHCTVIRIRRLPMW